MPLKEWWLATGRSRIIILFLIACTALWELAVDYFQVPAFLVPAPSRVFMEVASEPGWFSMQAYYTIEATLIGFLVAVVVGILLAIGIVYSRVLEQTVFTALVASNSIPKVAIAPLLIIWIGTGLEAKVAMAAMIAIFPIIIDAVLGLRSIDPDMLDLARSLGGKPWQILLKIRFPNALPSFFAGMKVGISFALVGTIVGEFVASARGLGNVIMVAQSDFRTARIFAALIILALVGTLLFFLLDLLERLLIPWHASRRQEEMAEL
jgi:NitT/TauT family transport system permease protein